MAGPWVSPHGVIHGLQGKACFVGQEMTPKPQPRPQQSLTRCEQRELPVCPQHHSPQVSGAWSCLPGTPNHVSPLRRKGI